MTKSYDRAYFERYYHNKRTRVHSHAEVRRKVWLAVAMAEYFLRRPLRSVLDIGCGEGAWLPHLRALRPGIAYAGLDSSEYVVERFGAARNIRRASFGELPSLKLRPHDLVVCSDVLHYVDEADVRAGIPEIARICAGMAYVEVLTEEDNVIGDLEGFRFRPADWYRKLFKKAGMWQVGPYSWLSPELVDDAAELDL
jgi:SAM-dependent methyltransferase